MWKTMRQCQEETQKGFCLSNEDNVKFITYTDRRVQSLQPTIGEAERCTMLLLQNISDPDWVSINCHEKLLSHVVCEETHSQQPLHFIQTTGNVCDKDQIVWGGMCWDLHWQSHQHNTKHLQKICKKGQVLSFSDKEIIYSYIFEAIYLKRALLFSIELSGKKVNYELQKIPFHKSKLHILHKDQGLFACNYSLLSEITVPENTLSCSDGSHISTAFICDSVNDCAVKKHDKCPARSSVSCSPLLLQQRDGVCKTFVHRMREHIALEQQEFYTCSNGKILPANLVDDLVPDCPDAEDEEMYKQLLQGELLLCETCLESGQFPCIEGHKKCFKISELCTYRLNENMQLIPCRQGSHLANCNAFTCNGHFKCPHFHCVPHAYVSDGKWDCPNGNDEFSNHHFLANNSCFSKFRCSKTQKCLPLSNICDGYADCPLQDDELLCDLKHFACPGVQVV